MNQKTISPDALICMDDYADRYGYHVDLAYARADNLLFGEAIYRKDAKLWLHEDLAQIIFAAAKTLHKVHLRLILYDGLRTIEAQEKMLTTRRVRENPHWLKEPRLLSPPGNGGHPRAMAIDAALEDLNGNLLDMGTPFDYLAEDSSPAQNPAHRSHAGHAAHIYENRKILDDALFDASKTLNLPLIGLQEEWWDYRFKSEYYNNFTAISETLLRPDQKLL